MMVPLSLLIIIIMVLVPSSYSEAGMITALAEQNTNIQPIAKVEVISKRLSSGYLPIAEEYLEYQIKVTNEGSVPIQNQSLWALFTSKGNHTHSFGKYAIVSLNSGQSKTFFLGPYKMREVGEHHLFLGVNKKGDPALPNEALLNFQPVSPVDSFLVFDRSFIQIIPIGLVLLISGAIIIIGVSFYRRKRKMT